MSTQPSKLDITAEQLRSIYTQFQTIFDEKVSLHLPQEHDSVKGEVLLELQKFLFEGMDAASSSLSIINANESASISDVLAQSREQFVESFDLGLNERVRKKYQEWEDQTVKVAQLRREAPRKLSEVYESEANEVLREVDTLIEEFSHEKSSSDSAADAVDPEVDWSDLQNDYMEVLSRLAQVRDDLPKNRSKLQKLQQLISFLESELESERKNDD
ncbi:LAME_0B05204g1_1 [Lachancea meyersii CBS 8951]|uniref:LAME_0B05204g1_1 n=1 Tax=Lachancea meyersii CBS 8951 TaxID=1266667 RepID=A0A1G4IVK6_9SACH|nr:LAME_0B05204g1_1 [Lachancea meyersii CBS 8951]